MCLEIVVQKNTKHCKCSQHKETNQETNNKKMASDRDLSQKRVLYNAAMLTLRTVISIFIGFYTSRVTMQVLGIENFGINALIGGIVPLFFWFMGTFSNSISRFLTIEIGKGNEESIRDVFSVAFWICTGFALIIFILLESVGMWFITHKINIPQGREGAAMWCYQMSIISSLTYILSIPYRATITSHERFTFYAYNEIITVLWILGNVLILPYINGDKLIIYSALYTVTNSVMGGVTIFYSKLSFKEAIPRLSINKKKFKDIFFYALWDLYNYGCLTFYSQARIYFVNKFFGVRYNASVGVANSIESGVTGITNTVSRAFAPQITKQYAQSNFATMQLVLANSMKFSMLGMGLFSIPVMLNAETLIQLWLTLVPPSSPNLLRCLLITSFIIVINAPFITAIHSTGNIKKFSFVVGSLLLCMTGVIYITYATTHNIELGFATLILTQIIYGFIASITAKRFIPQLNMWLFGKNILKALFIMGVSCLPAYLLHRMLMPSLLNIVVTTALYLVFFIPLSYFFMFNKEERQKINEIIYNKISFLKKMR